MANTLKFGASEWYGSEGNILAYNDLGGNFKPLPFTFSRGSSATVVNKLGLIETVGANDARVDYKDNAKGALLLEPQRTNLETKSNGFSTWTLVSNVTRTADYTLSPEGVNNATRLQFTSNGFVANTTITNGTQYTVSVYAKRNDTGTQLFGFFVDGSGAVNSEMSLTSEWKRFSFTHTATNGSYVGLAGLSGADISVYGFQLEAGSYPTSYIPTQGTAQTRLADSCSQTAPDGVIGQTEGSVFLDITRDSLESYTQRVLTLSNGTTNNVIGLQLTAANQINFYVENGGSNQVVITKSGATTANVSVKIGISYKANDFVMYIDGVQVGVDTSGSVPTTSVIKYANPSSSLQYVGLVNNFKLYNTRLSNSELQALTTI